MSQIYRNGVRYFFPYGFAAGINYPAPPLAATGQDLYPTPSTGPSPFSRPPPPLFRTEWRAQLAQPFDPYLADARELVRAVEARALYAPAEREALAQRLDHVAVSIRPKSPRAAVELLTAAARIRALSPPASTGQLRMGLPQGVDITAPAVSYGGVQMAPPWSVPIFRRTRPLRHGQDYKGRIELPESSREAVQTFLRSMGFVVHAVYMNAAEAEAQSSDSITILSALENAPPASRWFFATWRGPNSTRDLPPEITHLWPVATVRAPLVDVRMQPPSDVVAPVRRWHPPPGTRADIILGLGPSRADLRAAPNPNAARIGGIDNGALVTVLASNIAEQGKTANHPDRWWQVQSAAGSGFLKTVNWDGEWLIGWSVPASTGTGQVRMGLPQGVDITAPVVDVRPAPRFDPVRPRRDFIRAWTRAPSSLKAAPNSRYVTVFELPLHAEVDVEYADYVGPDRQRWAYVSADVPGGRVQGYLEVARITYRSPNTTPFVYETACASEGGCWLKAFPGGGVVIPTGQIPIPPGFPLVLLRGVRRAPGDTTPGSGRAEPWFLVHAPTLLGIDNEGWLPARELTRFPR